MRAILQASVSIPYWRLQRSKIGEFWGGRGSGTRAVAAVDEDPNTLSVDAARALSLGGVDSLWCVSATPVYADKSNGAVVHAALQLDASVATFDAGSALRSGASSLRAALRSNDTVLWCAADVRAGMANGADEAGWGDAGAAAVVGEAMSDDDAVAVHLGGGSATSEFLDRWRAPGELRAKVWDEKFGEVEYTRAASAAWARALAAAGLVADDVDEVLVASGHARVAKVLGRTLRRPVGGALDSVVGYTGTAHGLLALVDASARLDAGSVVAIVSLSDGADVDIFRLGGVSAGGRPLADQIALGNDGLPYSKYLQWRGVLTPEPPRRPEPARMSGSAAGRSVAWKYGLVGSVDRGDGTVHLPPSRIGVGTGSLDDMDPVRVADTPARVVTFTVDRLVYSLNPPVVFAVLDFEGGGRLPMELTDVEPGDVTVGMTVVPTFRRIAVSDGIVNYFWKARPVRAAAHETKGNV